MVPFDTPSIETLIPLIELLNGSNGPIKSLLSLDMEYVAQLSTLIGLPRPDSKLRYVPSVSFTTEWYPNIVTTVMA
jgi:hypothetical protein